jgi:hypothetical protein
MTWRKSTYSGGANNNCVEVGSDSGVHVRDTKNNGAGPELIFASTAWTQFLASL